MDILPFNFRTCRLCGMWYFNDNFFILKLIYRFAVFFIIYQFTLNQIIELITVKGSVDELTEILFLTLTFVALCLKIFNFVTRRCEMLSLLDDFRSFDCQPKSPEEQKIIRSYSNVAAKIFLTFMILAQSTGMVLLVIPFINSENNKISLPFKSYHPLDVSNAVNFWIIYALQFLAAIYGVSLNVTMDTMVCGFIILTTAQFEINCYRWMNASVSIKDCIRHHVAIQKIVVKIQYFFIPVILPLFFCSLVTLCTSIFQMSQKELLSFEFLFLTMYLACLVCQVFIYCWFGNELQLKSQAVMSAVYMNNWLNYTNHERKKVWFVMLFAQRGTNVSFHGQCGLSINTFLWIVKTSYASFNLLQQASIEKS